MRRGWLWLWAGGVGGNEWARFGAGAVLLPGCAGCAGASQCIAFVCAPNAAVGGRLLELNGV